MNKTLFYRYENCFLYLYFLIFSIVVLFFVSHDSCIYDIYGRVDSAWFYMCGKAWMNGLTPYVDFTDSKGLVLWLIYGIGYLISPDSYFGVYWMSCFTYAFSFLLSYKVAFLLTENRKQSLAASMLMVLSFFNYWFHYEIRAEDFCHPAILSALYVLILVIKQPTLRNMKTAGFVLGAGLVYTIMIKWSIAVILGSFVLSVLYIAYLNKQVSSYLGALALSFLLCCLPFAVYFVYAGNFYDFIHEYFINTTRTVSHPLYEIILIYVFEFIRSVTTYSLFYVISILFIYQYCKQHKEFKYLPVFCAIVFYMICIHGTDYYMTACSFMFIFAAIWMVKRINIYNLPFLLFVIAAFMFKLMVYQPHFMYKKPAVTDYDIANTYMSKVENPKIINESYEFGIGLPANTLPAVKFWAAQNGETKAMRHERWKGVRTKKADFVIVDASRSTEDKRHMEFVQMVKDAGYVALCDIENPNHGSGTLLTLYGKPMYK